MKKAVVPLALALFFALLYCFSNPHPAIHYNYTSRIAEQLLLGRLGLPADNPSYLNEFVPWDDRYYSVFPLGAVLTMLPFVLLGKLGLGPASPEMFVFPLCAGLSAFLTWKLTERFNLKAASQMMLVTFLLCGTWMWTNLTFGGAWQIALGWAVVFQLAALTLTFCDPPRPFWIGFLVALAFGNRTEVLLTAPVFLFLFRHRGFLGWRSVGLFALAPATLGILTLAYNYARFGSVLDFGYSHIPGVLNEPWYRHGIFSWHYIPYNIDHMLLQTWKRIPVFPYWVPNGFGGSILLASPFILLLFWRFWKSNPVEIAAFTAIFVMTLLHWCHGNAGGWQYSYRYAMVLLPWMILVFCQKLEKIPRAVSLPLLFLSVAINAWATFLFYWTDRVRP